MNSPPLRHSPPATLRRRPPTTASCWTRSAPQPSRTCWPRRFRHRSDSVLPSPCPGRARPTTYWEKLRLLAQRTVARRSLIGQGYYGTRVPPVVLRNVLENPAWYTAYTPYQPEISQGRLETLLNFQTMVAELTGLELANASLLDEATAAAEAMTMARRVSKAASHRFVVDADTHPQTIEVLRTRALPIGIDLVVGDAAALIADGCFGVLLSLPTSSGAVADWAPVIDAAHHAGALVVVATDLLACVLMTPPGHLGADIAVGSAQRFGVPMGFGGPHAGFMATSTAASRSLPGRLVGVSTDTAGRPALRLALQTREQHIRREKATSNICTAQVLLANMAGLYASWHGPDGLAAIAERVHGLAGWTAAAPERRGARPAPRHVVRHDHRRRCRRRRRPGHRPRPRLQPSAAVHHCGGRVVRRAQRARRRRGRVGLLRHRRQRR
ncbi:MAG: hypothetical protein V9E89_12435 [Ilumatobacteraceae bacterium]